jgi:methylated-DNA-[protein]-cysteine S-methyltransferase
VVLSRYFGGELDAIESVGVELNGTEFQKRVWQALRRIPAGSTLSYAEVARRIGDRTAVRAVGAANGANPVAIVVPCHRVIGSDGALTGYGGGLDRKRWLLEHEHAAWKDSSRTNPTLPW